MLPPRIVEVEFDKSKINDLSNSTFLKKINLVTRSYDKKPQDFWGAIK